MRIVKQLLAQINDELDGAKDYAINALDLKQSKPELSRLYKDMASTEYQHANSLHEWAVRYVDEARASGVVPPPEMIEKWEQEHRLAIARQAEVKVYIDLYR